MSGWVYNEALGSAGEEKRFMKAEQTLNAKTRSVIRDKIDGGVLLTLCIIYAHESRSLNVLLLVFK